MYSDYFETIRNDQIKKIFKTVHSKLLSRTHQSAQIIEFRVTHVTTRDIVSLTRDYMKITLGYYFSFQYIFNEILQYSNFPRF